MKIRSKLFLIALFFLGIYFLNIPKVFAQFDEMSNCPYYDTFITQISSYSSKYNDSLGYACFQNKADGMIYYVVSNSTTYPFFAVHHYYYDRGDGTMRDNPIVVNVSYNDSKNTLTVNQSSKFLIIIIEANGYVSCAERKSQNVPNSYTDFSLIYSKNDFFYSQVNQNVMLQPTLYNPEKILFNGSDVSTKSEKLFELNLFDKNFNDAKHTFTLKANKDDVRYNELMELINNKNNYCIYLTDYARLLTYEDNSFYSPLKSRLVFDVAVT